MNSIHIIDAAIVGVYLIACIWIGLYRFKSTRTLREYTLGRGDFPDIVIVTTILATFIGAGSVTGIVAKTYELGMFCIATHLCIPLFWLIMVEIYAKNINQFRGCMSLSDIMELLYGQPGRWITNILSTLLSVVIITIQAKVMGYTFQYFFQIPSFYGTSISILILAFYSALGGIRAVTFTDLFQFAVFITVIPLTCSYAYHNAGGYNVVINSLPEKIRILDLNKDNIWLFLSLLFFHLLPIASNPYVQRFLISSSSWQLVRCLRVIAVIHLLFIILVCLIGLVVRSQAPDIDPYTAFIYFIENYLHVGIKGLAIAGLLAVVMSTADSWLNTISVTCAHDIASRLMALTDKQALLVARFSILIVAALAIYLSRLEKGVVELVWFINNFWEPIITIPFIAGFLKFRTNFKSFIASVIVAIIFTGISGYIAGDLATISLMCGTVGSAIGLFGMHYWQKYQGMQPKNKQLVYRASSEDVFRW